MALTNRVAVQQPDGSELVLYEPQTHPLCNQAAFHLSDTPNLLALGTRGTGKSVTLRWDAIIRCLLFPGFKALLLRRKLTDLRKSHLRFIGAEVKALGCARYRENNFDVIFDNDSFIQFSHCESDADVENYLSSEWDWIGFDELVTFKLAQFLKISAAARTPVDRPYIALVRACSNTLGPGAAWMKAWFIDKKVDYEEYPDYNPADFEVQYSRLEGNKYIDTETYAARLRMMPENVRRSWLNNEFVFEGAYFGDFHKTTETGDPWHVIQKLPRWKDKPILEQPWIAIYRTIDWGYDPDPAVCLWIAMLPDKSCVAFHEMKWQRTIAKDVARDIVRFSEGMKIVDTFCDPTMFIKTGTIEYSIGELFENNGVALTPAQNSRELYGYSVHEYLNTIIGDDPANRHPQLQILESGCPHLIRTFPTLTMDPTDTRKIANGEDHFVVALAYFCMGKATPRQDPRSSALPLWMRKKKSR